MSKINNNNNNNNLYLDEIKEKVEYFFKVPKKKYLNPITSSQEIGWQEVNNMKVFKKFYTKNSNDITKFANDYYIMLGKSPFVSSKIGLQTTTTSNK